MNAVNLDAWGLALTELLVQVTLWTALGLVLYAVVARGRPRARCRIVASTRARRYAS